MILLFLTTVLLVPQWQVVPTAAIVVADHVVAEDDDTVALSSTPLVEVLPDEQKEINDRRKIFENTLKASNHEVAATLEAYEQGRTTADQLLDAKRRNLQVQLKLLEEFPEMLIPDYWKRLPIPSFDNNDNLKDFIIVRVDHNNVYHINDFKTKTKTTSSQIELFSILRHMTADITDLSIPRKLMIMCSKTANYETLDAVIKAGNEVGITHIKYMILEEVEGRGDSQATSTKATPPAKSTSKFTPAEQERLKALYMQIVEQEDENRKMIEDYYNMGDQRGNALMHAETLRKVCEAKITLSMFILNETDLTPQEYASERQNLRTLYEEMREAATFAVSAAKAAYENQRIQYAEVAQYERKLTEIEIALIRLFPEKE